MRRIKKVAGGVVAQPCPVDGHTRAAPSSALGALKSPGRFSQHTIDRLVVEPLQKAVQGGVVRHAQELQDFAQLAVLAQTHFGFTKRLIFVAHQAEHGQQLRLGEFGAY